MSTRQTGWGAILSSYVSTEHHSAHLGRFRSAHLPSAIAGGVILQSCMVCKNGGSVIRPSGAPLSIIAPDIVQRAFAKMDFHSKLVDAKFQLGVHFNLRDKQTETLKYLFHGRDCIGRSDVSAA